MADPISGGNRIYRRKDGEYTDERRAGAFEKLRDNMIPVIVIGLLTWLCMGQINLQSQMAVLVDRSTTDRARLTKVEDTAESTQRGQAELQRQFDEFKGQRR